MPAYFDSNQGFFVRKPSWHHLENLILADWPGSWEEARAQANLLWEPVSAPVYTQREWTIQVASDHGQPVYKTVRDWEELEGWQQIKRNDTDAVLTVQTDEYRIINNTEFGAVIESVLGMDLGESVLYEGVFTLFGGKLVIALVRFAEPISVPGDPSETLQYAAFCVRHDGQGGLKVVLTNIRVVCANTWGMAEHSGVDAKTSFVIRHTKNWDERVALIREGLVSARTANFAYTDTAEQLLNYQISLRERDEYLMRFLPTGTDMGDRQKRNRAREREEVREILASPTCQSIGNTAYGLLQASGEWADHHRGFRTADTYVNRTLFTKEPLKERAFRLTKQLAGAR